MFKDSGCLAGLVIFKDSGYLAGLVIFDGASASSYIPSKY